MSQLLSMKNISKHFGAVQALSDVSIDLNEGEVLALMGENGAGKSTLMNALSGGLASYDGEIFVRGERAAIKNPTAAEKLGIAKIHQELQLVPYMSVAENMCIGHEPSRWGIVQTRQMNATARDTLAQLELDINPRRQLKDLRVGEQQLVEIAKALMLHSKILIMDEPTSAISKGETEHLFKIIRKLKSQGVGIIYITHRMEEVFQIADRITVLRDGRFIKTVSASESSQEELISLMVGRDIGALFPKDAPQVGAAVLEVENLCFTPPAGSFQRSLQGISLQLNAGEVLGLAGLMGAGRSEFCECLFGTHAKYVTGRVRMDGKDVAIKAPGDAIRLGISFATEDRKGQGLVLQRSIGENISLPLLKQFSPRWFMDEASEAKAWKERKDALRIKATSVQTLTGTLSGGNQQKVVLGRWTLTKPRVLILDEPTRGIDVGAKAEIYQLINDLAKSGIAILVVSSEMPELIGISDRIVTFCEGRMTGEFSREDVTQEKLLWAATRRENAQYA